MGIYINMLEHDLHRFRHQVFSADKAEKTGSKTPVMSNGHLAELTRPIGISRLTI